MGKPCSCMQFIKSRICYYKSCENPYQYCKSRENPYQVLQVTREFVSGTTSHVRCVRTCNEIEGLYDKITITIVPSYTGKISLVCCHWHCYLCCALSQLKTVAQLCDYVLSLLLTVTPNHRFQHRRHICEALKQTHQNEIYM